MSIVIRCLDNEGLESRGFGLDVDMGLRKEAGHTQREIIHNTHPTHSLPWKVKKDPHVQAVSKRTDTPKLHSKLTWVLPWRVFYRRFSLCQAISSTPKQSIEIMIPSVSSSSSRFVHCP